MKLTLEHAMKAQMESRGVALLFLSFFQLVTRKGEGGCHCHAPATLRAGTGWLGRPQDQSRQVQKISPPPGFDPCTFKPTASCYIDIHQPRNLLPSEMQNTSIRVQMCVYVDVLHCSWR
jgi:hypothetical protein